ncbi:hypothetical protein RJ641_001582 [Dillenia turbinata]|uniref:Uncharacterized protein n=1 Tax=Dillenia turbinata TaxID=194707 RepID=A0AAN8VBJ2_9MAGN
MTKCQDFFVTAEKLECWLFCVLLQYDTYDSSFITTDDFTNADILEATYLVIAKRLHNDWITDPAIPIVTGFLRKNYRVFHYYFFVLFSNSFIWGWRSCAVTTVGWDGSDLTATTIGKTLGLQEI